VVSVPPNVSLQLTGEWRASGCALLGFLVSSAYAARSAPAAELWR
jgi:hypothetical protein